ncbi:MAG: M48 family metallopeptidase [Gammaproteobacteria bacterium]|nr:M48 family metallopeptidase [Gammaproteobacteria bacterium]MBT8150133.1 M48 family metallopeptidase [Gammaproteobacteria bacterium]NNL11298.1 M48 family metallopeptidase [Pseudomonadales bacterium]NNM10940.1 M48 family metallopeptidase [Pseudomonadales bacterium]
MQVKCTAAAEQLPLFCTPEQRATAAAAETATAQPATEKVLPGYALTRSRRKTLCLGVEDGQLIVRAPHYASINDIESFIIEKQRWVTKQLAEDTRRQQEKIRLFDGATFQALGAEFRIEINILGAALRSRIDACMEHKLVTLSLTETGAQRIEDKAEKLFRRWLTSLAAPYMQRATRQLAAATALDRTLGEIGFRYTRSKWGHCTSAGDIQYNPAVVLAPTTVVDYIVAHEVCHLRHRNHSRAFWRLVEKCCPEWRTAEHWLRHNGHRAEFLFCI